MDRGGRLANVLVAEELFGAAHGERDLLLLFGLTLVVGKLALLVLE